MSSYHVYNKLNQLLDVTKLILNDNNKIFNTLNAELNPICHLLALLGGATIVVVSRLRVNVDTQKYTIVETTVSLLDDSVCLIDQRVWT
jgi:hypothetical protein